MARAGYIWIVTSNREPVRAFTVKKELIGWLDKLSFVARTNGLRLFRLPDGGNPFTSTKESIELDPNTLEQLQ